MYYVLIFSALGSFYFFFKFGPIWDRNHCGSGVLCWLFSWLADFTKLDMATKLVIFLSILTPTTKNIKVLWGKKVYIGQSWLFSSLADFTKLDMFTKLVIF